MGFKFHVVLRKLGETLFFFLLELLGLGLNPLRTGP